MIHPRIRTGYSFRHSAGALPDVMSRLKEVGATVAPITDRASTFGLFRWGKLAKAEGLRPVYGVELAVSPAIAAKKPAADHWTFLAIESVGAINRLVELATTQFRYQPLLSIEQALAAEGVIRITGNAPLLDWEGEIPRDTYVALSPSTPRGVIKRALAHGWPVVAASDNRYPRAEDGGFYEVLVGRNASTQTYDLHIQDEAEWRASIQRHGIVSDAQLDAAIARSGEILDRCHADFGKARLPKPPRPDTLENMCRAGAARLGVDLDDPVYAARMERELTLIAEKEFEDYFYIVTDLVMWSRERMVVGPARGSSCGSLVCYLLGITSVDPIPYGLIFERFIDVNRHDLPDIDVDFSDQQRHEVFEYLSDTYGREFSARLGTVTMFQPRSALKDCAGAFKVPPWEVDPVVDSLITRSSGDSRALNTLGDTLVETPAGRKLLDEHPEMTLSSRFEGHPRHYSQHACGFVIADQPITDYVAIDHRTGATMCDKKDAEDGYGLLKIDVLGLIQLSIFEDALELAGLPRNTLEGIPLDDQAAFDVLNRRQYSGIFQFMGQALQSLAKSFRIDRFDDLVSITALARPGPMASGGANEWVHRRSGAKGVSYPHPLFEPYLRDTMGIVLYQEQVMEIGREIGDLDWGQVTALRKAMSKSLGKEFFDQFGDPWKAGAIAKGVPAEIAEKVWDDLCAYGAWSFNKSHSVAYGLISYWCCWLKAHHPHEYAAAVLTHEKDTDRQIQTLRELIAEGYDYVPVDPVKSGRKWAVTTRHGRKFLVGPLTNVIGLGPKLVQQIEGSRARGEPMPPRAEKLLANPKTPLDSVWPIRDAVRRVLPDPAERNIHTPPTAISRIGQDIGHDRHVLLFCTPARIVPRDENEEIRVVKRGSKITDGKTAYLNLFVRDDTDEIYCKVNRFKFKDIAQPIIDRGRPGKALYALKGRVVVGDGGFRMVNVDQVRYLGDTTDEPSKKTTEEA